MRNIYSSYNVRNRRVYLLAFGAENLTSRPSVITAAQSMIELSRTQDEEVGDGTTSVIILGECLNIYAT